MLTLKGPKINGVEGCIYHINILCLVARHFEEQALQKILFPPHRAKPTKDTARRIIAEWNRLKYSLLHDSRIPDEAKSRLADLGLFDSGLVYTEHGARRVETLERNSSPAEEYDSCGEDEPEIDK